MVCSSLSNDGGPRRAGLPGGREFFMAVVRVCFKQTPDEKIEIKVLPYLN
jgi:hypothetical protein